MIRPGIIGCILLSVVVYAHSLDKLEVNVTQDKKCGQTPCPSPGVCCSDKKNCCCVGYPVESFTCYSNHNDDHSWTMPWWGNVLVIVAIVAIVAAIVFVCYRRKKRQSYGQI